MGNVSDEIAQKAFAHYSSLITHRHSSGCPCAADCAYWQPAMPWNSDSPDEELMLCYRDGDAGAFDVLYRRHRGGLFRYIARLTANPGVAEELFQDVWANLIRARRRYTVSAKFTTYLYRLAHNRVIDYFRAQGGKIAVSLDDEDGEALPEPRAERQDEPDTALGIRQQAARLLELLAALPAVQREAFLLQQEGDLSVEQIAAATGVSRETAKSRLRYALAKLRQGMSEWE
jgi:RNA polymerase sigma-70 factor (ECF subfamily)